MHNVLMLCGSLRRGSLNQIFLDAAAQAAPTGVRCVRTDALAKIPPYDQDRDGEEPCVPVASLRRAIADADGLMIATPEYNYGIPGALKNALDWASRPYGKASLAGKVVAVVVVTSGAAGGFQGGAQLRALLADMENFVLAKPLLVVQQANSKLTRQADGSAAYTDGVGQRLLAANWAALTHALDHGAGPLCQAGSRALAALAP